MKILLIGKSGSINHWLEDAIGAFRAAGHIVRVGLVRRAWLSAGVERALGVPLAERLAGQARRYDPDLILSIGGFHAPLAYLERLAAWRGRAPLVGWVGDRFDAGAAAAAGLYDLVAYTDSGLLARHGTLGFPSKAVFLPHAANPAAAPSPRPRSDRMIFIAAATPDRQRVIDGIQAPMVVRGPGWRTDPERRHDLRPDRIPHSAVAGLYAGHRAVLNIRNEHNVLGGLNQRGFDPCLSATPVLTDAQADLDRCFEPGTEVLAWRSLEELNALDARLIREPGWAARIGEAGRRRMLADHTFDHRLAAILAAV